MNFELERARGALDIVIPSRGEGDQITACLTALLCDAKSLHLRVVVVVNGENSPETRRAAAACEPAFVAEGHELIIVESERGKFNALNVGDGFRRPSCPTVYLDADAIVLPGTLPQLQQALTEVPEPTLAAPRLRIAYGESTLARAFGRVWSRLPIVRSGLIGGGCYAVNESGRRLWTRFPDIAGDDAFVCALFDGERQAPLAPAAIFIVLPPSWQGLTDMRTRWLRSAREGAAAARRVHESQDRHTPRTPPRLGGSRWRLLGDMQAWTSLPTFAAIDAAARTNLLLMRLRRERVRPDWRPQRATGAVSPLACRRPRVLAIVVTYNSARYIAACLESIRSAWASLRVVVFDNASKDASADLAAGFADVHVVRSERNLGFGAAVNRAAGDLDDIDQILLLNPDAILDPGAIDTLLAASLRYPQSGLIGGRARTANGDAIAASCMSAPSLSQALRYAFRLSSGLDLPPRTYRDPTESRPAPAVIGACMLVDARVWRTLGGFDERFFLYGEDVDLSLRARKAGFSPTYVAMAGYVHAMGASLTSAVDRRCYILAGLITLYRAHGGRIAPLSRMLIQLGVLFRAYAALLKGDRSWLEAWRRRDEWRDGHSASRLTRQEISSA